VDGLVGKDMGETCPARLGRGKHGVVGWGVIGQTGTVGKLALGKLNWAKDHFPL